MDEFYEIFNAKTGQTIGIVTGEDNAKLLANSDKALDYCDIGTSHSRQTDVFIEYVTAEIDDASPFSLASPAAM